MKKKPQLLILIGAPGSGKTTFAKYHIRTHANWVRFSRDEYRKMQFSQGNLPPEGEIRLTKMLLVSIEKLLLDHTNVILDATHTKKDYLDTYIRHFRHLADIHFRLFEHPQSVLEARCKAREAISGRIVSSSLINRHLADLAQLKTVFDFQSIACQPKELFQAQQDIRLPKAVICDLDGTLALIGNRDPYDGSDCLKDTVNPAVATTIRVFSKAGFKLLLVSGRSTRYRDQTICFLEKNELPYDELFMRSANDNRKDREVKKEIFKKQIEHKYYIEMILDDRDQVVNMWRQELELTCFQVNYGNF
ncbi:MAG TPA: AAA family ATPase [Arachidicoccus sp.]|nr:AAA family ATPase [Arachidicoccus sp.]